MTETPQQPMGEPTGQHTDPASGQAGVDRENLRNYEKLRRSLTDRKVAGVAGGLGRHLNVDPTVLRVLFVVLCFFGGAGFVLYGAAWLLVPEDGRDRGSVNVDPGTRNTLLIIAGVVAGLLLVGDSWGGFGFPWPLMLIGIAVLLYLVLKDPNGSRRSSSQQPSAPYGPTPQTPYQPTYQPSSQETTMTYSTDAGTTYAEQPPWMPPTQTAPAPPPPRRAKHGPLLFGPTLALLAVALGALGLYEGSGGDVVASAYAALALTVVGLMMVLGSIFGRPGGLLFLGIIASIALSVTSVADFNWRDGDELKVAPASAAAVRDTYHVPTGRVFVDLSEVRDPEALDGHTIDVSADAGELVVVLPEGVTSDVSADIDGPGQIDLPGHSSGGFDNSLDETYGSGTATVTINADLSVGHIEVRNP